MTGGISTAPVEAQASIPAACSRSNPVRRIAGIDIAPVVSTLVITLPLIDPSKPLEKIETLAAPPRTVPRMAKDRSMKTLPAPVA